MHRPGDLISRQRSNFEERWDETADEGFQNAANGVADELAAVSVFWDLTILRSK